MTSCPLNETKNGARIACEDLCDGQTLDGVASRRTSGMRIHVVDAFWIDVGAFECQDPSTRSAIPKWMRCFHAAEARSSAYTLRTQRVVACPEHSRTSIAPPSALTNHRGRRRMDTTLWQQMHERESTGARIVPEYGRDLLTRSAYTWYMCICYSNATAAACNGIR